jgi:hypothetical protein
MQGQRLGKEEPQSGYGITRTLTIWLSLRGNSGGGDDCCRNHGLKQGQSRRGIAASHGIVGRKWSVRGRQKSCRSVQGRETKKQIEEEEIK